MVRIQLLFLLASSVGSATRAEAVSPLWSRGYAAIPEPQRVSLTGRDVNFGPQWLLEGGSDAGLTRAFLAEEFAERFGLPAAGTAGTRISLSVRPGSVEPGLSTDSDKAAIARQAYHLEIAEGRVAITANAPEGLFYGAVTLVQLLKPRFGALQLPEGTLTDWPDLSRRHIYWDDAHHLERLSDLKRAVRQAAFFKINGFTIKLEGHFQFKSAPALVEPYALSVAEFQELTDYGLRYHVQVIPYLDGPGHIAFILKHPEYAKYRAFPDSNYELCVSNPEAVKFLGSMFQDLVDANRGGKYIYLSTDEAYYVGMADSAQCGEKSAAAEKGSVGKLLARFIEQVAEPLHKQGRTVIFWGEFPLKPTDIEALPNYLVNGEVTGPAFDPLFKKHGIRQMIYTSTQGGVAQLFPDYFELPNARRLHPLPQRADRLGEGFAKISFDVARGHSNIMGATVAGWADMGLHPSTYWLGYATITAAAWHPGTPSTQEAAAAFASLYYGGDTDRVTRAYQLMSLQAQTWLDSWEPSKSTRKPLFGYSAGIFNPKRPAKDQTLPLPALPGDGAWLQQNARRLELASQALSENDELIALLQDKLRSITLNRYNIELYIAISGVYRQNLEMLLDVGRMASQLDSAKTAGSSKAAVAAMDRAIALAYQIRQERNIALRNATETYYKTWFPRTPEANGRRFLHDLDDVKDHVPDRTVDMSYLMLRELQLPFGEWVESIRTERNRLAASLSLKPNIRRFDWLDKSDHPAAGEEREE